MRVLITRDGVARMVYRDSVDLRTLGRASVRRVGEVEPSGNGEWEVKVGRHSLGTFPRRDVALSEEIKWVESELPRL